MWSAIGDLKTRFIPEVLLVKEYQSDHHISFSDKLKYSRGYAYAIALGEKNTSHHKKHLKNKIWKFISFTRYSIHGEMTLATTRNLWSQRSDFFVLLLMYPFGLMLAAKDIMQGKVVKTHKDFEKASERVCITVETLP